jgi:hypothetical protein
VHLGAAAASAPTQPDGWVVGRQKEQHGSIISIRIREIKKIKSGCGGAIKRGRNNQQESIIRIQIRGVTKAESGQKRKGLERQCATLCGG